MSYGSILNQTSLGNIPIGGIILWSGSINNIPKNYSLCNGSNGTPNLTDRFVIGAGDTYDVGSSGGEAAHTLTISEMPQHNHANDLSIESAGSHNHSLSLYSPGSSSSYVRAADAETTNPTRPVGTVRTGSSGTHTHTHFQEALKIQEIRNHTTICLHITHYAILCVHIKELLCKINEKVKDPWLLALGLFVVYLFYFIIL